MVGVLSCMWLGFGVCVKSSRCQRIRQQVWKLYVVEVGFEMEIRFVDWDVVELQY